jgi:hypothetical protein
MGLACLLSHTSTAVHMVLVEHVRCAEHGEWVHADEARAERPPGERSARGVEALRVESRSGAEDHDHDHCWLLSERHGASLAPASQAVVGTPERSGSLDVSAHDSNRPARLVYAFAPKTSPPA